MSSTAPHAPSPCRRFWTTFLLVAGAVLLAADLAMLAAVLAGKIPAWSLSIIVNLSIWSPVMIVAGALMRRYDRRTERLMLHGLPGTATIQKIHSTASRVGANPVLRLDLSVTVSGLPVYPTSARVLTPAHLLPHLHRGARLPVKVDPAAQTRIRIDWDSFENTLPVPRY